MTEAEHAKGIERHCSAIVDAIIAANRYDAVQCAFSVAASSLLIIGESDQAARSALAMLMMRLAARLDHDVTNATRLQ